MDEGELLQLSSDLRLSCMRIARRARGESRGQMPQHQYAVLTQLENGPRTLRTLADRENVSAPVMTRNVNELEQLGYVTKGDNPEDGRQIIVRLTKAGDARRLEVKRNRDEWMAARLRGLEDVDLLALQQTARLLQRLEQE